MPDTVEKRRRPTSWLAAATEKQNLASDLSDDELKSLGAEVVQQFLLDHDNRADWDRISKSALELAQQVKKAKSFPWEKASNVKHPLITVACIQFAARAYPEILKGDTVVKCRITGDDFKLKQPASPAQPPQPPVPGAAPGPGPLPPPGQTGQGAPPQLPQALPQAVGQMPLAGPAGPMPTGQPPAMPVPQPPEPPKDLKRERADRVSLHMNYQLTQEMTEWDSDMDRLLHILPVLGQVYKKTYRSVVKNRNVSELVLPNDCYVNKKARTLDTARRITHRLWFYSNDVWEKVHTGLWLGVPDLGEPAEKDPGDTDAPHEFLEQHCYRDLDGDGYKEPYVVTVHRETATVVRVVARWQTEGLQLDDKGKVAWITPDHYFTHYGFIPNPDGSLNYLGFGQLLEPINEAANSVLNQLIDAGTLSNAAGGFLGRGIKMRGGMFRFSPFEWKQVDVAGGALKENLVPLPVREPSAVLFQLLGFLVQAGKDISSVQDIMTGDAKLASTMPVGTMMALVEQGLKVFTAIYKRIYRSLTEEFMKLYKLNSEWVDPAVPYKLAGQVPPQFDGELKPDYQMDDLTVVPVADPNLSTDMQRALKSQALLGLTNRPGLNEVEITRLAVRAIRPESEKDILLTDAQINGTEKLPWTPPPNPQVIKAQANAQLLQARTAEVGVRLMMDLKSFELEMEVKLADITKKKADAVLALAKAKDLDQSDQMETFKAELDQLTSSAKLQLEVLKTQVQGMTSGAGGPGGKGNAARQPNTDKPGGLG